MAGPYSSEGVCNYWRGAFPPENKPGPCWYKDYGSSWGWVFVYTP
jgi:hypothetical protein